MAEKQCFLDKALLKVVPQFEFVLRARSNGKDSRPQFETLLVYDNLFCATDGRRLHYCRDKALLPGVLTEPGFYTVQGSKTNGFHLSLNPEFSPDALPNVKAVINKNITEPVGFSHNLNVKKMELPFTASQLLAKTTTLKPATGLQYPFICDLHGFAWEITGGRAADDDKFYWRFTTSGDLGAVILPFEVKMDG